MTFYENSSIPNVALKTFSIFVYSNIKQLITSNS